MRVLLLILFIIYLALPVNAQTLLTGEIEHSVQSTQNELLNSKPLNINQNFLQNHLKDENQTENISMLLKGNINLTDRIIAKFSDNSYAVMFKNNEYNVLYYSPEGNLTHYEVKSDLNYPYKSYKYDINNNLVNMGIRISKEETYIYTPNGKLIAHWIREKGFDEKGNLIMTRKYYE